MQPYLTSEAEAEAEAELIALRLLTEIEEAPLAVRKMLVENRRPNIKRGLTQRHGKDFVIEDFFIESDEEKYQNTCSIVPAVSLSARL